MRTAFVAGIDAARGWPDHERFVKLSDVEAVVVSEVLADLAVLESKAV
jgi:hypothetical protein